MAKAGKGYKKIMVSAYADAMTFDVDGFPTGSAPLYTLTKIQDAGISSPWGLTGPTNKSVPKEAKPLSFINCAMSFATSIAIFNYLLFYVLQVL